MSTITYLPFNTLFYSLFNSTSIFKKEIVRKRDTTLKTSKPDSVTPDPRVSFLEERITSLENGITSAAIKSVKSARFTLIKNLLNKGDNVVTFNSWALYSEDRKLYDRLGINIRLSVDGSLATFRKLIDDNTKLIYLETISPRFINIPDFQKITSLAQSLGIPVVVDNTGSVGGYLTTPISNKASLVIESLEDYLPYHAKYKAVIVDGGNFVWSNGKFPKLDLATSSYRLISVKEGKTVKSKSVFDVFNLLDFFKKRLTDYKEGYLIPSDPFSLVKRLEDIPSKVQLKSDNAFRLAKYLSGHPLIKSVQYTGFASNPSYFQATSFFRNGFGHYLSFHLLADAKSTTHFFEDLSKNFALKTKLSYEKKTNSFYLNVPAIEFDELKSHFDAAFVLLEETFDYQYIVDEPLYSYYHI